MLVRSIDRVAEQEMTMPGAEQVTMRLLVGRDDGAANFAMRQFTVAPGGHTPHHKHNYEHEILVLEGEGEAISEQGPTAIEAGDVIFMPPNEKHQFRNSGTVPMKFICMVPTQFDCGGGECADTPGS